MPNCSILGLGVFDGAYGRATATLYLQSQKSAVRKLIALISKVLLAWWDTRITWYFLDPQGVYFSNNTQTYHYPILGILECNRDNNKRTYVT